MYFTIYGVEEGASAFKIEIADEDIAEVSNHTGLGTKTIAITFKGKSVGDTYVTVEIRNGNGDWESTEIFISVEQGQENTEDITEILDALVSARNQADLLENKIEEAELSLRNYQEKLSNYEDDLADAEQELERAQTEKPIRIYVAGQGWIWTVDQNAIDKAEEDVEYYQGYVNDYELLVLRQQNQIDEYRQRLTEINDEIEKLEMML